MLHYYANKDGIPEFILALKKACEKLACGGVPMSDATLLATAHSQVFASLHYPEATREWERLPPALQTWASWQTKYREANVKRLRLLRANSNSFGAANNVTDTQITSDAIATALDNIANSATNKSPPRLQLHHNNNFTAIADTGTSHHYCHGRAPTATFNSNAPPTTVDIANGERIQSIRQAKLLLPDLPPGTEDCHIMSTFTNNLLSMG
jgi:hypothetical protein